MSPGGGHDVRRNSLLSVGICGACREPGFLFRPLQPTEPVKNGLNDQTLFDELSQSDRLVYLFLSLEMLVVYFPRRVSPESSLRR